jgi:superfamily I DNA/RNA helicase
LREFIASGAPPYSFSKDKIQTYNSWARGLLREHGLEPQTVDDFDEERANLLAQIKILVRRERLSGLYDAILLDETHDYLLEEIELLRRLGNNFFAVADGRQQIYRKDLSLEYLKGNVDQTIELKFHYRNGEKICILADKIMEGKKLYHPLHKYCNYNEQARPSKVQRFKCNTIEDQCEIIISEIATQMQAYPNELIGIICPGHKELAQVRKIISGSSLRLYCNFQDYESGYTSIREECPIIVSTVHSAKGLEFRAVHLAACDTFKSFPRTNRNMTFTGVTRAKTSLNLYYGKGFLYGYLEKALAALFPRTDRPDISEAFGRRK